MGKEKGKFDIDELKAERDIYMAEKMTVYQPAEKVKLDFPLVPSLHNQTPPEENFVGHGDYQKSDKLRTTIKLDDGLVVSHKKSDFDPNNIPSGYEDLGKWEMKAKSMLAIGVPYDQLKIVFFDACFSGRNKLDIYTAEISEGPPYEEYPTDLGHGDMSYALAIGSSEQIYKGWYQKSYSGEVDLLTCYVEWNENFWLRLGLRDSVYEAILYAISHTGCILNPLGPHENYRLRGVGDFVNIRLDP